MDLPAQHRSERSTTQQDSFHVDQSAGYYGNSLSGCQKRIK